MIYITTPILPDRKDLDVLIDKIYSRKILTNHGPFHNELEENLAKILGTNVSLFNNGTIALLIALKSLGLPKGSEVITTPFTFAATPHCIEWNGLKPVFCDIEPYSMTLDPDKIEALITPQTKAILGVHVYGYPCNVDKLAKIAHQYDLKVIYDAAHAFGSSINRKPIAQYGDITMFSFHSTKLFNTFEGGCLAYSDSFYKERIYLLRNFGIKNEEEVVDIGLNGKMNELQAAVGLLNLKTYTREQRKRSKIKKTYIKNLQNIKGIHIPQPKIEYADSFQYFPILVQSDYHETRDKLYDRLKRHGYYSRKYFFPVCSDYDVYKHLPSSSANNLTVTNTIKNQVLCLPYYGDLSETDVINICKIIHDRRS